MRMSQLPVPALLQEARVALSWSELSTEEQGMMNGWVKALFGPDGIDDETLLYVSFTHLTSPAHDDTELTEPGPRRQSTSAAWRVDCSSKPSRLQPPARSISIRSTLGFRTFANLFSAGH